MSSPPFIYFGTSDFSAAVLTGLIEAGYIPTLVVSTKSKPAGRGLKIVATPVSDLAQARDLPLVEVETLKSPEIKHQLAIIQTPLAILAAFGKIVPPAVLQIFPHGIINIHPSLLPQYRGPSPIQSALRDGQRETGVSLIVLDEQVDHGPIVAQAKCAIEAVDNTPTLSKKLAELSIKLLISVLPPYLSGSLSPLPQVDSRATFTKMITRDDGRVDFTQSAATLNNWRRAYTPWPRLWTIWQGKRIRLLETAVVNYKGEVGKTALHNGQLIVGCSSGGLVIKFLQLEGGKVMPSADFIRGHKNFINSQLK